jgi:hypothetical protein
LKTIKFCDNVVNERIASVDRWPISYAF